MRQAKKMFNEEKSMRILAESRGKTMESVKDNVSSELKLLTDQIHDKNIKIDLIKKQVSKAIALRLICVVYSLNDGI